VTQFSASELMLDKVMCLAGIPSTAGSTTGVRNTSVFYNMTEHMPRISYMAISANAEGKIAKYLTYISELNETVSFLTININV
jgi:hypothetical protein